MPNDAADARRHGDRDEEGDEDGSDRRDTYVSPIDRNPRADDPAVWEATEGPPSADGIGSVALHSGFTTACLGGPPPRSTPMRALTPSRGTRSATPISLGSIR